MGVGWYIVLERQIADLDAHLIDGKVVARAHEELDQIADELGLTPLSAFLSQSVADALAMAEEMDVEPEELPEEQWFPAESGLGAIAGILGRLREADDAPLLIADLEAMERALRVAKDAGVRFHFSVDS